MRFYKKQATGGEILVKAIDENNNYSVASNLDPESDGAVNHRWGSDVGQWEEITEAEADEILER